MANMHKAPQHPVVIPGQGETAISFTLMFLPCGPACVHSGKIHRIKKTAAGRPLQVCQLPAGYSGSLYHALNHG